MCFGVVSIMHFFLSFSIHIKFEPNFPNVYKNDTEETHLLKLQLDVNVKHYQTTSIRKFGVNEGLLYLEHILSENKMYIRHIFAKL